MRCPRTFPPVTGRTWSMPSWTSPEVQASTRLEATIPLGDGELLERLRERTTDAVTRPAGSTALLDANIPEGAHRGDRDRQPRDRADPEDL